MWNPFKKKPYIVFDDLSLSCPKCFRAFPKNAVKCDICGGPLEKYNPGDVNKQNAVQYGEKKGKEVSVPVFNADTNSVELHIRGEKYPMKGHPRHHVLHGPMAPLKRYIKNLIIEQLVKCLPHKIPDENLCPPVREIARAFDVWIEAEDEPELKRLVGQFKDAITMMLQEDDAWRYRFQWFLEQIDINKVKLDEADKYYFRGKSFRQEAIK